MTELPELVQRAQVLAGELGFPLTRQQADGSGSLVLPPSACLPGVGRFLAVLAAGCAGGVIGEYGTGSGVGTAWMVTAMPASCRLITAEVDEARAQAVRALFADDGRVEVRTGDAAGILAGAGPFDLIFADCGIREDAHFAEVVGLLKPGGQIVMDDVTPLAALQDDSPVRSDDAKRRFFASSQLISAEVVLPDLANSLLVGTRIA